MVQYQEGCQEPFLPSREESLSGGRAEIRRAARIRSSWHAGTVSKRDLEPRQGQPAQTKGNCQGQVGACQELLGLLGLFGALEHWMVGVFQNRQTLQQAFTALSREELRPQMHPWIFISG